MEEKITPTEIKKSRLERLAKIIQKEAFRCENANVPRMYKLHKAWLDCNEQAKKYLSDEYVGKMHKQVMEYIRVFQENNSDRLPNY